MADKPLFPLILIGIFILICLYLYKYHHNKLTAPTLFAKDEWFIVVNLGLIVFAAYYNFTGQYFCTPVTWATDVLVLFIAAFLTIPFHIKNKALKCVQTALLGAGVFILLYIIVFASDEYLIFAMFLTALAIPFDVIIRYTGSRKADTLYIPILIVLTPYFLLLQLARYYRGLETQKLKRVFIASPLVVLAIGLSLSFRLNYLIGQIDANQNNPQAITTMLNNPVDNYLGELVLGAHWKYHTELCIYDGTRPPLHDPVLGFAHMLHLHTGVGGYYENFELYKKVFPGKDVTLKCRCSY